MRWTIVKMAITLLVASMVVVASRLSLSSLVHIMQWPLHEIDPKIGAFRAMGVTDSLTISFRLAFYAGIVLSFPLLLYFVAEFVLPALTAVEKRYILPGDLRQLRPVSNRSARLLFLASAERPFSSFSTTRCR